MVRGWSIAALLGTAALAGAAVAGCGSQEAQHVSMASATTAGVSTTAADVAKSRKKAVKPASIRQSRVKLRVPTANAAFGSARTVTVPRGWSAEVWALVPDARLEAWTPQHKLLVSSPDNGEILQLSPGKAPGGAPSRHVLLSGLQNPQGMAFAKIAGKEYLFVAESDEIDRYRWNGGAPGARKVIAADLPDGGSHSLKNVVVSARGTVFFDIGSATNASPPATTTPPRATVMAVAPNGSDLRVFARGVRNGDGLSLAPDGTLWVAVNERDDVAYPFHKSYGGSANAYAQVIPSYVAGHPPDELARLTAGRNLGWPYCNPDPDVNAGRAGTALSYANLRFDRDVQSNADGQALDCGKLQRIQRGLPAHSAPLGFHFLEGSSLPRRWRDGAVVAVHGSWDRQPPRAPEVYWLPWRSKARTLGHPVNALGGFQSASGSRWGRPVDAVAGPDGALYVSDDQAGAIYRLVPGK